MLAVGAVFRVWWTVASPPKEKFFVCVDVSARWFFIVNSEMRRLTPAASFPISPAQLPVLRHDSYMDTSETVTLTVEEVEEAATADPSRRAGASTRHTPRRLAIFVNPHDHLVRAHKRTILRNLWAE